MKRPDGVTAIAITHFFIGALVLLGVCFWLALMPAVIASEGSGEGRLVGTMFFGIFALATLVTGVLPLLAGWGLLRMKEWARWLTIILAILMLFGFPVGTAIGGLIIWYLLQPQVALAFGSGVPIVPQPIAPVTPPIPTIPPSPWPTQSVQLPAPGSPGQGTTPPPSDER